MSLKIPQERLPDYVAWAGVITAALGHSLAIAGPVSVTKILTPIGLGLFMAGIVLAIRDVQARVKDLQVENLVSAVRDIQARVKDLQVENDMLSAHRAVSDTGFWMVGNPSAIHVRATSNVLNSILRDYVPRLANNLKQFTAEQAVQIEVEDQSPVFGLMYEIAQGLPIGSAWLGITLLENESAWETPLDDTFIDFRNLMRQRAEEKELSVLRLYYFRSEQAFTNLRRILCDEVKSGIIVRYLIDVRPPPPDISLLWLPPRTVRVPVGGVRPIDDVHRNKYVPLCLLDYATRSGLLLTKLSVRAGTSESFGKKERIFAEFWGDAKVFEP